MVSSKLKIAIIGAGSRGIQCFGQLFSQRDDCEVVALCDKNPVRMQKMLHKLNGTAPRCYVSVQELYAAENLDACVVTTPDCFHAEHALSAIGKGLHVLIDKPLSTNVKDGLRIIEAAEESGNVVMIGFNLRHHAVLQKTREIIRSGAIGDVILIENREFYSGGRSYMSRWNRHYDISGGLWIHKGSHDFDVFNWLLDFPMPTKVAAMAGTSVFTPEGLPFTPEPGKPAGPTCTLCAYKTTCPDVKSHEGEPEWGEEAQQVDGYAKDTCMYLSEKSVHDNGIMIIEYAGGIRASHMECFFTSVSDRRYSIVGTKGQLEVSLTDRTITLRPRWHGETITYTIPSIEGGHGGADPGLVDSFVSAITNGSGNTSTVRHGLLATAIGQAAELAVRENRTILMNELLSDAKFLN